jgi:hypothetical protein
MCQIEKRRGRLMSMRALDFVLVVMEYFTTQPSLAEGDVSAPILPLGDKDRKGGFATSDF